MSAHFSKFGLATMYHTPYFQAFWPEERDIISTLVAAKSRRKLPMNILELSNFAWKWAMKDAGKFEDWEGAKFYNVMLQELNPETGEVLTDEEILADWGEDAKFEQVEDISLPKEGLPSPLTWEPEPEEDDAGELLALDKGELLEFIASHGRARAAEEFGVEVDPVDLTDEELADLILAKPVFA